MPNPGDYLVLWDEAKLKGGDEYKGLHSGFIARRCWWWIKNGKFDYLVVEAEFAEPFELYR